jgi:hypothetical protein
MIFAWTLKEIKTFKVLVFGLISICYIMGDMNMPSLIIES